MRGNQAYMPNIAASPEGPQRFNNSTQAFVNVLDGTAGVRQTDGSAGRFLNLHLGARTRSGQEEAVLRQPVGDRVHATSPATPASRLRGLGRLGPAREGERRGNGRCLHRRQQTTRYIDLNDPANPATAGANAGKNPQGIVVDRDGTRAYVRNFVSRNVSVVDLRPTRSRRRSGPSRCRRPGLARRRSISVGAEMFFASRGQFDRPAGATGVSTSERLSSEGWQSCSSCHFNGPDRQRRVGFGTGPRKSLPLNASFNPADRDGAEDPQLLRRQRRVEDFEINIRNVSGPGNLAPSRVQLLGAAARDERAGPQPRPDHRRQRRHQHAAVHHQRVREVQRRPPAGHGDAAGLERRRAGP